MTNQIIAISGFAGSGKNTVAEIIAKELGWKIVQPTFKDLANTEGISLEEFQLKAKDDPNIDRKFDEEQKKQSKDGKCVITTWLGPWMNKEAYKVWLDISLEERARRVAGREGKSIEQTIDEIRLRDEQNVQRYVSVYGIDIRDHREFDLILSDEKSTAEENAHKIIEDYKSKSI
jgi:CMP/dCMP kinase